MLAMFFVHDREMSTSILVVILRWLSVVFSGLSGCHGIAKGISVVCVSCIPAVVRYLGLFLLSAIVHESRQCWFLLFSDSPWGQRQLTPVPLSHQGSDWDVLRSPQDMHQLFWDFGILCKPIYRWHCYKCLLGLYALICYIIVPHSYRW